MTDLTWESLDYQRAEHGLVPFDGKPVLVAQPTGICERRWAAGPYRSFLSDILGLDPGRIPATWVSDKLDFLCAQEGFWMPLPEPSLAPLRVYSSEEIRQIGAARANAPTFVRIEAGYVGVQPSDAILVLLPGRGWFEAEYNSFDEVWMLPNRETVSPAFVGRGMVLARPEFRVPQSSRVLGPGTPVWA